MLGPPVSPLPTSAELAEVSWGVRPLPPGVAARLVEDAHRAPLLAGRLLDALRAGASPDEALPATLSELLAQLARVALEEGASPPSAAFLRGMQALQRAPPPATPATSARDTLLERACLRGQLLALRFPPYNASEAGGTARLPISAPPWYKLCNVCQGQGHFSVQCAGRLDIT